MARGDDGSIRAVRNETSPGVASGGADVDGQRFDDLTKNLSTAARSRRGVVRGLVGGAVGAILGGVTIKGAVAQVSPAATDAICEGRDVLCDPEGNPSFVCADGRVCARNVNGDKQCVEALGPTCSRRQRCRVNRDCDRGQVCIRVSGCTDEGCSRGRGRCYNRCRA